MLKLADDVACNLCGSAEREVVFEAGRAQPARIVRCRECRLMYSSPRARAPDEDLVREFDPEHTKRVTETDRGRFEKERLQVRDYANTLRYLSQKYPERGKLLEIGCGMGFLLAEFARDGWDVVGVEPNRGFCEFIEEHHRLPAVPAILDEAGFPDNSFDAAIMLHVIEHVPDPVATLQGILRVLKPGGRLIMETPRYDTLMFRLLRHRERSLSCEGHIYFYTTETLRKSCEKAGFRFEHVDFVGRSLSASRLLWNVGVMTKSRLVQNALGRLSSKLNLENVNFTLNVRDMQRMILVKPEDPSSRPA